MTLIAHEEIRAAKKEHQCDWCYESILPGQPYVRQRNCEGRDIWTWRAHPECYKAFSEVDRDEQEFHAGVRHARGCQLDYFEDCDCPGHKAARGDSLT